MRTYGRTYDVYGNPTWQVVTTDANGYNDAVYITTLAQCLKLNLGESPFYANYGLPAKESVLQQVAPDFQIALTQQQFAPFFAALTIAKTASLPPTYRINAVTQQGSIISAEIPA
jgi:uncharacterized protein YfaA (DUF2138 family)